MLTHTFLVSFRVPKKINLHASARSNMRSVVLIYALLIFVYLALVWFLPPNRSSLDKYNLSVLQGKLLGLTFVLPIIGVWISALYGYVRFRAYANIIRDTPEGSPFSRLADGLMLLAFGLPITAIMSSLFNFYSARHTHWLPTTTIIRSYTDLTLYFLAFLLLFIGAKGLYSSLKTKDLYQPGYLRYATFITITISTIFIWLLLANPFNPTAASGGNSVYYLPNWLVIFTIAIPYLLSWYYGAMASYWLLAYRSKIKGKVYQQPFGDLASGIAVIVFDAVFIRFITSLSPRLERLNLTPILLIIYVLVLLYIIGYGLVAKGAKGLKKIEEV